MTRSVLTAGLLSVAALGLGIVSAQAAPSAPLTGLATQTSNTVEKAHGRDWRWYHYRRHLHNDRHFRRDRHHRHDRHHRFPRWW